MDNEVNLRHNLMAYFYQKIKINKNTWRVYTFGWNHLLGLISDDKSHNPAKTYPTI